MYQERLVNELKMFQKMLVPSKNQMQYLLEITIQHISGELVLKFLIFRYIPLFQFIATKSSLLCPQPDTFSSFSFNSDISFTSPLTRIKDL